MSWFVTILAIAGVAGFCDVFLFRGAIGVTLADFLHSHYLAR